MAGLLVDDCMIANSDPVTISIVHDIVCVTAHDSPQSHFHDLKGLYKPLVSKLLIPGYVIGGVPSPRQPLPLPKRQRGSSRACQKILDHLLIQHAGAVRALERTGRLT